MDRNRDNPEPLSVAAFTAAGRPFELIEGVARGGHCRVFRNAPRCLAQLYPPARAHAAEVFTVMDGTALTYAEVFSAAATLAAELASGGVGKGTHEIGRASCRERV
jgi:hypothetical protein